MGLSAPLRYTLCLAAANIAERFESGIIQRPSRIFSFEGFPRTSYDVAANEKEIFTGILERLYETFGGEKTDDHAEREELDSDGEDYGDSDQPSSSPVPTIKRKLRESLVDVDKRNRGEDRVELDLPS